MSQRYRLSENQERVLQILKTERRVLHDLKNYLVHVEGGAEGVACDVTEFANLIERGLIRNLYGNVYIATQLEMF